MTVEDLIGSLRQLETANLAFAVRVEKAHLDPSPVRRKERKIRTPLVRRRAKRIRLAFADFQSVPLAALMGRFAAAQ